MILDLNMVYGKGHIVSEETRRKISEKAKQRMTNPEYIKKLGDAQKKAWTNPEHKKKMSESQKKAWTNPELRKKQTESHKGQIGWNKGKKGLQVAWNRGISMPEEQRRRMSETRKIRMKEGKIKNWMKGKHPSAETLKKQREAVIKTWANPELREQNRLHTLKMFESGSFPRQMNTKPERQVKKELIKRGYKEGANFIHQFKFMNKFMCDFCFPNQKIIVEVDGDFWHGNPKKYSDQTKLHPHQIKGIGRDKSKKAYIKKVDNGSWTLLRFWESDIEKDVVKCVDKIEEVLAEKKKV